MNLACSAGVSLRRVNVKKLEMVFSAGHLEMEAVVGGGGGA